MPIRRFLPIMKSFTSLTRLAVLGVASVVTIPIGQASTPAQTNDGSPKNGQAPDQSASPIEILSDTQGVDFNPYLREVLANIRKSWRSLIPAEGRPPALEQADTVIRVTINPDGAITSMRLESSDHKDAFNRAAWGAISSQGKFPPLPAAFTGPNLQMRIRFVVNKPSAKQTPEP